jgi:hypothetical protein
MALAEVVDHFLKVEGKVELLRKGKPTAVTPKVQDGVEPGNVIQTRTPAGPRWDSWMIPC